MLHQAASAGGASLAGVMALLMVVSLAAVVAVRAWLRRTGGACPHCGKRFRKGASVCNHCGRALAA
jgi:predicted amidophosphoribosyltransferase